MSSSQTNTPSAGGASGSPAGWMMEKTAPCGSNITAIRPTSGMSNGSMTFPPAALAFSAVSVFSIIQPAGEPDAPPAEGVFVWDELMTTDVEAAKAFYGEVLGWTSRDQDMGGMTYTLFQRSGDTAVGGCMARPEGVEAPPHWTVYIATDDVDASVVRAKELGANVFVEPTDIPNMGRFAVLQDPTGAAFGIFASSGE